MERNVSACDSGECEDHFHFRGNASTSSTDVSHQQQPTEQHGSSFGNVKSTTSTTPSKTNLEEAAKAGPRKFESSDRRFQRIVRNFTPSWFIITMSTGVVSICLHQLPYNGNWLQIISVIFFVLNITLFVTFTLISCLRYIKYPHLISSVLHHPHQSLFVATFPVGLATLINMTILVCAPVWGHGMAIFAWVLWWIDSVMALATCFHLTFVIMSNRRSDLAELTALYLIPIVAVVIVATSGGLVASALPDYNNQLWTLVISYIFWGLGSPLSWIILTLFFLRMTLHKPLQREIIVSLLLPIGPLSLSGFALITLGKVAKRLFPAVHAIPHVQHSFPGEIFYIIGMMVGVILWGFAIVWFVVAVVMIGLARRFPFNMGWWGFIFPIAVFTLLTITIGEELESKFFRVLSCVLTVICVLLWIVVALGTIRGAISGKMFYAPCLGTDLHSKKAKAKTEAEEKGPEKV